MVHANRIAEFRKKIGLTQRELADRAGTHWVTISKLENGRQLFTFEWAEKLAPLLHVGPMDLLPPLKTLLQIPVAGVVMPGGITAGFDPAEMPKKLVFSSLFDDPNSFFVLVKGRGFAPIFHNGDLLRFTHANTENYEKYIGRICAVRDLRDDGTDLEDEFWVGMLQRGSAPGRVELHNPGYDPIPDIELKDLAQLTMAIMPESDDELSDAGPKDRKLFSEFFPEREPPEGEERG